MAKKVMDEIKSKSTEVSKPISLDEIIHEYSQIANELELGEVTEELEERLSITKDDINRKMLGYRYVILNNEAKVNTIYKPELKTQEDKNEHDSLLEEMNQKHSLILKQTVIFPLLRTLKSRVFI